MQYHLIIYSFTLLLFLLLKTLTVTEKIMLFILAKTFHPTLIFTMIFKGAYNVTMFTWTINQFQIMTSEYVQTILMSQKLRLQTFLTTQFQIFLLLALYNVWKRKNISSGAISGNQVWLWAEKLQQPAVKNLLVYGEQLEDEPRSCSKSQSKINRDDFRMTHENPL